MPMTFEEFMLIKEGEVVMCTDSWQTSLNGVKLKRVKSWLDDDTSVRFDYIECGHTVHAFFDRDEVDFIKE